MSEWAGIFGWSTGLPNWREGWAAVLGENWAFDLEEAWVAELEEGLGDLVPLRQTQKLSKHGHKSTVSFLSASPPMLQSLQSKITLPTAQPGRRVIVKTRTENP